MSSQLGFFDIQDRYKALSRADDQTEYQIRERLAQVGAVEKLFARFARYLEEKSLWT